MVVVIVIVVGLGTSSTVGGGNIAPLYMAHTLGIPVIGGSCGARFAPSTVVILVKLLVF